MSRPADEAVTAAQKGQFIGAGVGQQLDETDPSGPPPARGAPNDEPAIQLSPELELRKMLTLEQVTALTTLSADSLKRHHSDKIKRLGPRRLGMTLGDALAIGESA